MKSRKKFTVSDSDKSNLDGRLKKKITSSIPLLQKNLPFLENYNNLFRKPIFHFGDADSYFRRSLRNYDEFDLIRELKKNNFVRAVRSSEVVNKQSRSSKQSKLRSVTEIKLTLRDDKQRTLEDDKDIDVFYSPNSDLSITEPTDKNFGKETKDVHKPETDNTKEETSAETTFSNKIFKDNLEIINESESEEKMAEEFEDLPELDEEYESPTGETEVEVSEEVEVGEEVEDDEEDQDLKEVEKIINEASTELEKVAEENQQIIELMQEKRDSDLKLLPSPGQTPSVKDQPTLESEQDKKASLSKTPIPRQSGDGSVFKFDPKIDAQVLQELDDAERQAKETAKIIYELKNRVAELLKKEQMTEVEAKELEQKNKELKAQMMLFEEKTKRIQFLMGQSNLFLNMIPPKPPLQRRLNEDTLPKVIVCGNAESFIPKIIVCEKHRRRCSKTPGSPNEPVAPPPTTPMPQFAQKLNDSYCMQERLAAENADLEGKRYKLQSDLIHKDQAVECLQRQLTNLQSQMRVVCKENTLLNDRLHQQIKGTTQPNSRVQGSNMACGKGRGSCPADVEARLQQYSETTQQLERQLGIMENEVKDMHQELVSVQKERQHLEHHRKMLCVPPPSPCTPPPCPPPCPPPHVCTPPPACGSPDQRLRELKEQYNRLQDDFKGKLVEVAGLRTDNERFKKTATECEEIKKQSEERLRELEKELKLLKMNNNKPNLKEQFIEQEQQLNVAKQRFREAQDELEELRALIQDQQAQLDDYRNKYLEAQQSVEEQRRQIDMMDMENNRINEQVNLEIQRVKNQFQEKLQELTPLPDILKTTQIKLQEAQQMHLLAERNNEALSRELQTYKDKLSAFTNEMNEVRSSQQLGEDEKAALLSTIEQCERKYAELVDESEKQRQDFERMEIIADEHERQAGERLHEVTQLTAQLEGVREESARQVARTKDRCETIRRSMQNQINELERQLAQSRASAKGAQKERDDIRQKMQAQINNLNENFEDAQMRIRNLQGHVNFLKTSAGNVFSAAPEPKLKTDPPLESPCSCGRDY